MSSEGIQEIQEIPEDNPAFHEDIIEDIAPVVPTRGRGRPKGAKNKVKILVVDTDIPSVTLAEEPTEKEEATPIQKKPPIDPLPERRVSDHVSPIASMMISLHEMRQERMAARKAMYRNMIA